MNEKALAKFRPKNTAPMDFAASSLLTVVTLFCLVPFLGKPFHVDDPLFVWSARQIVSHPLDFYGFDLNWEGRPMPVATITQNPPLSAYYLAVSGWLMGWSEASLHAAFLLPAVAVILGTYRLAKRLCLHPLAAGLAAVCSPVFVVSSTSLMCDTMMLAFWVWAVCFWTDGLDRQSQTRLLASAVLIGLASLTKYFGMCVIPLLLVYAIQTRCSVRKWLPWLGLPVLTIALYQWWTQRLYGKGLLLNAAAYATGLRVGGALPAKILAGLSFSGGCLIFVLFAAPFLWGRRGVVIGVGIALFTALILATLRKVGGFALADEHGLNWCYIIQLSLFAAGGLGVLALAGADWLKHRNPDSTLLCLWTAGVFVFACIVNWTVSGRNILPMLPAVACLAARRLEATTACKHIVTWQALPAALSLVVAMAVARADYALAVSARQAARSLHQELSATATTVWFEGHWGFQFYIEQLGGTAVDQSNLKFSKGDAIILPASNSYIFPLPRHLAEPEFVREVPTSRWVSILNLNSGAGYYSDGWGPLPFVFGHVPPDVYFVLRAK